jgi:DNA-binding MarR family transcriptional regulator
LKKGVSSLRLCSSKKPPFYTFLKSLLFTLFSIATFYLFLQNTFTIMTSVFDISPNILALALVAAATLRQQSKKRKVGAGQLHVLLTIHLLTSESGCGILASELNDKQIISLSLLRAYVRQLEANGYLMRYSRYNRDARRIYITAKGHTLVAQCQRALCRAARELQA